MNYPRKRFERACRRMNLRMITYRGWRARGKCDKSCTISSVACAEAKLGNRHDEHNNKCRCFCFLPSTTTHLLRGSHALLDPAPARFQLLNTPAHQHTTPACMTNLVTSTRVQQQKQQQCLYDHCSVHGEFRY